MSRFAASTGPFDAPVVWWFRIWARHRRRVFASRRSSTPESVSVQQATGDVGVVGVVGEVHVTEFLLSVNRP
jgi:hypothetical protein